MKSAIIHDWVVTSGGAEKCLKSIYSLYPSDLFTLVSSPEGLAQAGIPRERVNESFISRLPFARTKYRSYLPLFPAAVEQFDLSGYDLVISSSHACAKGVLTTPAQLHICYCYTPIRYAWDLYGQYLREAGLEKGLRSAAARAILHYIRLWDMSASSRPDHYIAISKYIAARIRKTYRREATVIYPPVDVDSFPLTSAKDDFYLTASRMVPYKKMDAIVEAFAGMPGKKLLVVGDGPDMEKIKSKAGKNVEFAGWQPDEALKKYLQRARAFVFAAEEDFGIVPVEAQACGTPVIAFSRGGSAETITPETGVFFHEQTPAAIRSAVEEFEANRDKFDPAAIRRNAERFSAERFRGEFDAFVKRKYSEFAAGNGL